MTTRAGLEYSGLQSLRGPLAFVSTVAGVGFQEYVEVVAPDGSVRGGRVLAVTGDTAIVEVFGSTEGLALDTTRVRFSGRPLHFGVGPELLGRIFDGRGEPRDGLPRPVAVEERPVEGAPINPCRRAHPRDFLETGVSAIDGLNTIVLGQKLPIFTEAGLPHDTLVSQIVRQARAPGVDDFAIVFVALGLPREASNEYIEDFTRSGALRRVVAFLNYADDAASERLITPRCALTAAEYLAFDLGLHVLVVIDDVTNYGEALREVSAARGEVPSRKGYPGYLYSDLASIFERAGRIRDRPGSLTQIPVVTMPSGDLTHPIPDLTGYVTEGQIVLDRELHRHGVYPPIAVLPSLSRLMNDGIGDGRTRSDHEPLARQLYVACARVARARSLEAIIGRDELSSAEAAYLAFGDAFERRFLAQDSHTHRPLASTLDLGWAALSTLPRHELNRVPPELLDLHLPGQHAKPPTAAGSAEEGATAGLPPEDGS